MQAAELRRIERDLHDGAQARLVALSMQLGRAEEGLADRPEIAALVPPGARRGDARRSPSCATSPAGSRRRSSTDRGLAAAVEALGRALADPGDRRRRRLARRPPAVIETAAYFVVAESLTNVAKHAPEARRRGRPAIGSTRCCDVTIADDGPGGADAPRAAASTGCGARVAALDGEMRSCSPAGGGTRSRRGCHAGRDRRGPRCCCARAWSRCCANTRSRSSPRPKTARACSASSAATSPTWRSSTCGCRRPSPTRGSAPRSRPASATPTSGVLILSQYVEPVYTAELLAGGEGGVGYLLKERVGDIPAFLDAIRRVADGGTALDREVVAELVQTNAAPRPMSPLDALSPREREVLSLMAEGRTNAAIAERSSSPPARSRSTSRTSSAS